MFRGLTVPVRGLTRRHCVPPTRPHPAGTGAPSGGAPDRFSRARNLENMQICMQKQRFSCLRLVAAKPSRRGRPNSQRSLPAFTSWIASGCEAWAAAHLLGGTRTGCISVRRAASIVHRMGFEDTALAQARATARNCLISLACAPPKPLAPRDLPDRRVRCVPECPWRVWRVWRCWPCTVAAALPYRHLKLGEPSRAHVALYRL